MRTTTPIIASALVGILALSACGGGPKAEAGTAQDFVDAFLDDQSSNLGLVSDEMSAMASAAEDIDVEGAEYHASNVVDIFNEMIDSAENAPGADTAVGESSIDAFTVCRDAYSNSADAFESFDLDAIEDATDDIADCTDAISDATADIQSVS